MFALRRLEEQQKKLDEYETKEKELRDKSNEQEEKIEKLRKDLTVSNLIYQKQIPLCVLPKRY